MTRTVDLVIAGTGSAARAAAADALRSRRRILVVLRSDDGRAARRLRQWLRHAVSGITGQVTIVTGAEVVCVDGVDAVEAVVIRHVRTGRLWAVNSSAFLSCTHAAGGCVCGRGGIEPSRTA